MAEGSSSIDTQISSISHYDLIWSGMSPDCCRLILEYHDHQKRQWYLAQRILGKINLAEIMSDDSKSFETRSSGDLWSEICSDLPAPQDHGAADEHFTDSFQPQCPVSNQSSFTSPSNFTTSGQWEPMADSAVYIASLENRLKRIKGQSNEVTSREMLRSLSQAKKECWDRFLHDAQTSELFQEGELDQSALEQLKRWLSPERVAISAEELEYLLLPSKSKERASQHSSSTGYSTEEPDEEDCSSPEK